MKTIMSFFLSLAALGPMASVALTAQELGSAPNTGTVLLLASERILQGEIERIGQQYRIRRGRSEVWIPAEKNVILCADVKEALDRMKSRANLADADERLRLARWCQLNNLRDEALAEGKCALEMRPAHAETRLLVETLERAFTVKVAAPAQKPAPKAAPPVHNSKAIDVNGDALTMFTQKVQPILMNACASCHTDGRGGEFQLVRTSEAGTRGATQKNLATVLAQLNMEKPPLSPLLIKSVSAHGENPAAPIKSQQSVPYRTLTEWIDRTLASNPHLRERWTPTETTAKAPAPTAPAPTPPQHVVPQQNGDKPGGVVKTEVTKPAVVSRPVERIDDEKPMIEASERQVVDLPRPPAVANPATAAAPLDPFDPAIFNRQMQPKK